MKLLNEDDLIYNKLTKKTKAAITIGLKDMKSYRRDELIMDYLNVKSIQNKFDAIISFRRQQHIHISNL